ncbi:hypothetical protein [Alkalihalobacterium alkalinitrilicum]|uniref:hypothetical protein n=1 Tax=Alkalihalobacterium alkalinitrilicum TaxID=427920 RepID=UPI0013033664|nr:hypothetical protein [Alkalihalobacterium alkalinitrilicum]
MKQELLKRVFDKLNKNNVIDVIKAVNPMWVHDKKKQKRKKDLFDDFLALSPLIRDEEIEEFVEMAVMTKNIGLPAFTYKVNKLDGIEDHIEEREYVFLGSYIIKIEEVNSENNILKLNLRVKSYNEKWRTAGLLDMNSLTSVHNINLELDKVKQVATIFAGNDLIHQVVKDFCTVELKWPLVGYRIIEKTNQSFQVGSISFKTAVLLDFINNRLAPEGFISKFKEIKFNTTGKLQNSEGIRNVTINGNDILSSQLACEYITRGTSVISFKLNMIYSDREFSAIFSLKDKQYDLMKIVIVDVEDQTFKENVMRLIQDNYIEMCSDGIKDMKSTNALLDTIKTKFAQGDKFVNNVIETGILNVNKNLASLLEEAESEHDYFELVNQIVYNNKIILDAVGYSGIDENLEKIKEFLESDLSELDEENEDDQVVSVEK